MDIYSSFVVQFKLTLSPILAVTISLLGSFTIVNVGLQAEAKSDKKTNNTIVK